MLEPLGFYDLLLLAISAPIIVAAAAAMELAVPAAYLLAAGSVPASGLIGYALFVDPPE